MRVDGTYTIRQLAYLTKQNMINRYTFMKRDVLKGVLIRKTTELNPDRPSETSHTLEIRTYSYPNYPPYSPSRDIYKKQRSVKHQYDIVLSISLDKDGKASADTTTWTYRVGSQKKWKDSPPYTLIKALRSDIDTKWKIEEKKELEHNETKYTNKKDQAKGKTKIKEKWKRKRLQHERNAKYLDIGDYNSQVQGIMGDFRFRCEYAMNYFGHLFGKDMSEGYGANYISTPFLDKHFLRLINFLLKKGILT